MIRLERPTLGTAGSFTQEGGPVAVVVETPRIETPDILKAFPFPQGGSVRIQRVRAASPVLNESANRFTLSLAGNIEATSAPVATWSIVGPHHLDSGSSQKEVRALVAVRGLSLGNNRVVRITDEISDGAVPPPVQRLVIKEGARVEMTYRLTTPTNCILAFNELSMAGAKGSRAYLDIVVEGSWPGMLTNEGEPELSLDLVATTLEFADISFTKPAETPMAISLRTDPLTSPKDCTLRLRIAEPADSSAGKSPQPFH